LANSCDERQQIVESMLEHVSHDPDVDGRVTVHEHVSKTYGRTECLLQLGAHPSRIGEETKQFVVGSWLTKSIVRHDVRRDIESGLNCKLKGVFYEAPFANITIDVLRPRESSLAPCYRVRRAQFSPITLPIANHKSPTIH
jgi:hypothetical protein